MKGIIGAVAVGVGLVAGAVYTVGGVSHIPVGSVGIVKHMDGKVDEIQQGWHWTGWTTGVQEYPTFKQSLVLSDNKKEGGDSNTAWKVGTADQQELPVNTSLTWSITTKNATALYQAVGGKDIDYVQDSIVSPTMKNIVNAITHKYGWNEIKGAKQAQVTEEINKALKEELAKSGIEVGVFGFTHVGSPAGMDQAQSALASAELGKQKASAEQAKAQIENETMIQNAKAKAQATEIEAEATQKQATALNEYVIQKQLIEKWDGKLPQVAGQNTMMQLPTLGGK